MSLTPRTFEEIRDDALNYIYTQTPLTDDQIGSIIRSLVEAASLEDDEQYFQIVQLLDSFNVKKAVGSALDKRVNDADIDRLAPSTSAGKIVILNGALPTSFLYINILDGVSSLQMTGSDRFPTAGFPYTIRLGEGTSLVEDVSVSALNTTTNVFTLVAPTLYAHSSGDRVSYVSGAGNQTINSGLQIQTSASDTGTPIRYTTVEKGTLVNGNYYSTPINAKSNNTGTTSNIGPGLIKEFVSSGPFDGAGVTNLVRFSGGKNKESDPELQERYQNHLQTLSKATVLSLKEGVKGVTDPVTGQSVTSSSVVEDFANDEVIVYIDDGRGFSPDYVQLPRSTVRAFTASGASSIQLSPGGSANFPEEGYILISPESSQIELVQFTNVNYSTDTLTLATNTTQNHDALDEVTMVDPITLASEAAANFYKLSNYPILRNSYRVWVDTGAGFTLQVDNTNYILNRGTGNLQIIGSGLPINSKVVATYSYYTGLVSSAQKVLAGNLEESVAFPGVYAAGIRVVVETPTIRRITRRGSISVEPGFDEETVGLQVQETIETYISGLGIGSDVIMAKATELAMSVVGMKDIIWNNTDNIIVLENELPVPFDSNGTSLITIV